MGLVYHSPVLVYFPHAGISKARAEERTIVSVDEAGFY